MKASTLKTALLIDAGYLDKLCYDPFGPFVGGKRVPLRLDLKKLPGALLGAEPARIYYYACLPYAADPPLPAEHAAVQARQRFFDVITRFPRWTVRLGVLEKRGEPRRGVEWYEQKRVDVWIAVDLIQLAERHLVDEAVLLTGDSDFVPAIAAARETGLKVCLLHGPGTAHPDLIAAVDQASLIDGRKLQDIQLGAPPGS